jgi:hypothetical protein
VWKWNLSRGFPGKDARHKIKDKYYMFLQGPKSKMAFLLLPSVRDGQGCAGGPGRSGRRRWGGLGLGSGAKRREENEGITGTCSPTGKTDGDGRILKRGGRRWSSGRPNHRRPGHRGARVNRGKRRGDDEEHLEVFTLDGGGREDGRWWRVAAACGGPRWRRRVRGRGGGCGARRVKGRPQGLWGRFYSARKARGGDSRSNGHQWPWGAALIAWECLIGEETKGG